MLLSCNGYDRYISKSVGAVSDGIEVTNLRAGTYLSTDSVDPGFALDATTAFLDDGVMETTVTPMLLVRRRFGSVEFLSVYIGSGPSVIHATGLEAEEVGLGWDARAGAEFYLGDFLGCPLAVFVEGRALYRDIELKENPRYEEIHCQMVVVDPGERIDLSGQLAFLVGLRISL